MLQEASRGQDHRPSRLAARPGHPEARALTIGGLRTGPATGPGRGPAMIDAVQQEAVDDLVAVLAVVDRAGALVASVLQEGLIRPLAAAGR